MFAESLSSVVNLLGKHLRVYNVLPAFIHASCLHLI